MRYGVPYKGSKNGIAEWIYSHFPKHQKELWQEIRPEVYKQIEFNLEK